MKSSFDLLFDIRYQQLWPTVKMYVKFLSQNKVDNTHCHITHTCLFPGIGAFLWQITAMAPSVPISRVMSHSKELLGVAVLKVTPFFTVALWKGKNQKVKNVLNVKCATFTTNRNQHNEQIFFQIHGHGIKTVICCNRTSNPYGKLFSPRFSPSFILPLT